MSRSLSGIAFWPAQDIALAPTRMIERVAPRAARTTRFRGKHIANADEKRIPETFVQTYHQPTTRLNPASSAGFHYSGRTGNYTLPVLQQNRIRRPLRPSHKGYPYRALPNPNNSGRFSTPPPRPPFMPPLKPRNRSRRFSPFWISTLLSLLALFIILSGGIFAYYQTELAPSLQSILGNKAWREYPAQPATGSELNRSMNILLLGSDTDGKNNDPERGQSPLAQTIMIVTINPQTQYVGLLSIPRDMQVTDDAYVQRRPYPKIDEVFMHAFDVKGISIAERVSRAAGHTMDVIEENYGIRIDHYAWVGLKGFIKVIDTAGGVDVDVIHPMVDDTYPDDINNADGSIYDYKRLYIAPGPQHLNGIQALEYVRTRHSDLIGDFGRTIRQQQILTQLKPKLATSEIISKAPQYLRDLTGSLYTDLNLADIITLGNYARQTDLKAVERVTLGPPTYAIEGTTRPGNYIPVCDEINQIVQKMFQASPTCLPQMESPVTTPATSTPEATPLPLTPTPVPTFTPQPAQSSPVASPTPVPQSTATAPSQEDDQVNALQTLLGLLASVATHDFVVV